LTGAVHQSATPLSVLLDRHAVVASVRAWATCNVQTYVMDRFSLCGHLVVSCRSGEREGRIGGERTLSFHGLVVGGLYSFPALYVTPARTLASPLAYRPRVHACMPMAPPVSVSTTKIS
jgi:hypothetical protein